MAPLTLAGAHVTTRLEQHGRLLVRTHDTLLRLKQTHIIIIIKYNISIGLYRENVIAIESEAKHPFGGNVYYVTMQITLPIPEFTRNERHFHCDILHITTDRVARLVLDDVLDDAIAAIQTSR